MDYMMAGKPILHSVSAGNDPVAEVGCGIAVPPNDSVAIANAALEISRMSLSEKLTMGQKGEDFIRQERSYKVLANQFLKVIAPDV
jgi:hypothetical protein